jgi:hypothetical protein
MCPVTRNRTPPRSSHAPRKRGWWSHIPRARQGSTSSCRIPTRPNVNKIGSDLYVEYTTVSQLICPYFPSYSDAQCGSVVVDGKSRTVLIMLVIDGCAHDSQSIWKPWKGKPRLAWHLSRPVLSCCSDTTRRSRRLPRCTVLLAHDICAHGRHWTSSIKSYIATHFVHACISIEGTLSVPK